MNLANSLAFKRDLKAALKNIQSNNQRRMSDYETTSTDENVTQTPPGKKLTKKY